MKIYDAFVIGAGPAGLMAAGELEKNNLNYLIIDSKAKLGHPLRCGEIVREETFTELFGGTDYPFIKNKIVNISFRIKEIQKIFKKNMFMLDKAEFLQWLSEPIKENLMLNTRLAEIKKGHNSLEIHTSKGMFHAKLAVLASGANYKIQKALNLVKKDVELVPCIGGLFTNTNLDRDTAYFHYDEETYIASWMFPKEHNIFNAGAGIMLRNRKTESLNLRTAFKKSTERLGISLEGEPSFGGHYVTNGPIHRTYSDHLLVCGDSAGQVFAGIGEGIYFSLKAGQLAGKTTVKAIKKDNFKSEFLKEYEVNWRESFGRQMDAGFIFATNLFFLMRHHLSRSALRIIKPEEIADIWFNGNVSFRLVLFYFFLKLIGSSPKR